MRRERDVVEGEQDNYTESIAAYRCVIHHQDDQDDEIPWAVARTTGVCTGSLTLAFSLTFSLSFSLTPH